MIRDIPLLVVLDNFEQVVMAAPQLSDLLSACQHLKFLVTSRIALHVRDEHEFPVLPLLVPDLNHPTALEVLSHHAAVALFLERARSVKPNFQMTPTNARTIAEICVHLDGLPLAIELAAARMKLLTPQALLARFGQRLDVLTYGARDLPVRQQTLRNTIAWSYGLLGAAEQQLFRRLSVFVGGWTLKAAEAVCTTLNGSKNDVAGMLLDRVNALLDNSSSTVWM
jgi:predicted ATPase